MTMFAEVKHFAEIQLPDLCLGNTAADPCFFVADLLRQINYCPKAADLSDTHKAWATTLHKPIRDRASAARTYKKFAAAMNADMLGKAFDALKQRAATGAPKAVMTGDGELIETLEDTAQIHTGNRTGGGLLRTPVRLGVQPPAKPPITESQTVDAVVERLLETSAIDSAEWGAW